MDVYVDFVDNVRAWIAGIHFPEPVYRNDGDWAVVFDAGEQFVAAGGVDCARVSAGDGVWHVRRGGEG